MLTLTEPPLTPRTVRLTAGLSLRKLAQAMQISPMYLSDLERSRRDWSLEARKRWEAAMGRTFPDV